MNHDDMVARLASGSGFIAALDQSGGSTPKALKGYGIEADAWNSDDDMFGLIHAMRARIIRSAAFTSDKVLGAILFERTMDGVVDGVPTPRALANKGIVPLIKIDKGLEDEADGVQLMKPMPELDVLLARSKEAGMAGTKERSVINLANRAGIASIVAQQFEIAAQVIDHGLVPIIEPEVNIKSPERAAADVLLATEIEKALDALPEGRQVMLKLSIPCEPNRFSNLVRHPKVLRVVALSGGFARPEACAALAQNTGMIASFSRALLEDLRHQMTDAEFDAALGGAINEIYAASTHKG
jgi:fructose-bisphosphate aldolase, class I